MQAIKQHIHGQLITDNGRYTLKLINPEPQQASENSLYLRYALVIMGPENHFFPAFLLDDWGNEIRGLKLYEWVYEFGEQFPRAELFGFERDGQTTQYFVRGLELYAKYPCYAYTSVEQPLAEGALLDSILLPDKSVTTPLSLAKPTLFVGGWEWKRPLRSAAVFWWQVPV